MSRGLIKTAASGGEVAEMLVYIFFRKGGLFYPIEIPRGLDTPAHLAEHAALNPGTIRIEDFKGKVVWREAKQ